MKIKTVYISGFGPFGELSLKFGDVTAIVGKNGSGKTSILNAIRWCLFGKNDEALINTKRSSAEVAVVIDHDGSELKVIRTFPRGKSASLDVFYKGVRVRKPQTFVNEKIKDFEIDLVKLIDNLGDIAPKYLVRAAGIKTNRSSVEQYLGFSLPELKDDRKRDLYETDIWKALMRAKQSFVLQRQELGASIRHREEIVAEIEKNISEKIDPTVTKSTLDVITNNIMVHQQMLTELETLFASYERNRKKIINVDLSKKDEIEQEVQKLHQKRYELENEYKQYDVKKTDKNICPIMKIDCPADLDKWTESATEKRKKLAKEIDKLYKEAAELNRKLAPIYKAQMAFDEMRDIEGVVKSKFNIAINEVQSKMNELRQKIDELTKERRKIEHSVKLYNDLLALENAKQNLRAETAKWKQIDGKIKKIDEYIAALKRRIQIIKGLDFDEKITYRGISIEYVSESTRMMIAMSIVRHFQNSRNNEEAIIMIDGAERFDEENLKAIIEHRKGSQLIFTAVRPSIFSNLNTLLLTTEGNIL